MAHPATIYGDIAFATVDCLALILTLLRLSFRLYIQRFWWEDAWAVLAFVCGTGFITTQYISADTVDPKTAAMTVWMTNGFSKTTLLAVRMSILYSIIRIIPQLSSTRTIARIVGIVFVLFWAISIILKASLCKFVRTAKLMSTGARQPMVCTLPELVAIFQVITDWASDAILVILPLKLLWRVKLPRRQRRMILTLFTSSAIVSVFSLVHSTFQLLPKYVFPFTLSYNLEMMFALFVCNLLVVVTYVYRAVRKSRDGSDASESDDSSEDDDFTTRAPQKTTEVLTTIDLNIDASYSHSDVSSASHYRSAAAERSGDTGRLNSHT